MAKYLFGLNLQLEKIISNCDKINLNNQYEQLRCERGKPERPSPPKLERLF